MTVHRDRDAAIRTRADALGMVLTLIAVPVAALAGRDWLLMPAGYWTLALGLRLVAGPRRDGSGPAAADDDWVRGQR